jgi:hypothetical protein
MGANRSRTGVSSHPQASMTSCCSQSFNFESARFNRFSQEMRMAWTHLLLFEERLHQLHVSRLLVHVDHPLEPDILPQPDGPGGSRLVVQLQLVLEHPETDLVGLLEIGSVGLVSVDGTELAVYRARSWGLVSDWYLTKSSHKGRGKDTHSRLVHRSSSYTRSCGRKTSSACPFERPYRCTPRGRWGNRSCDPTRG